MLAGVWGGAWITGAVLHRVLGLEGTWVAVAIVAGGLLGGIASLGEARTLRPYSPDERRDAILGWGLIGGMAALACLFLPRPWDLLAAASVVAATVLVLRRV